MPIKAITAKTWLYYTDGTRIGYFQRNYYGGFTISTVHMPCRECGTGFGLYDNDGFYDITLQRLLDGFMHAPSWASQTERNAARKYRDIAHFLTAQHSEYERVAQGIPA
jgi:hypothetical protein